MLILAYPKSGSTWLGYLLADCLEVPYANKEMAKQRRKQELSQPDGEKAANAQPASVAYVLRTHSADPQEIAPSRDGKTVYLLRDGRDIIVSYHFWRYYHVPQRWPWYKRWALEGLKLLRGNQEARLARTIRVYAPAWRRHLLAWQPHWGQIPIVRYCDLNRAPVSTLQRLFTQLNLHVPQDRIEAVVAKHSFDAKTERAKGEEDRTSFRRKGIVGDWRNHFTLRHRRLFNELAGDMLIALKYEPDPGWISQTGRADKG